MSWSRCWRLDLPNLLKREKRLYDAAAFFVCVCVSGLPEKTGGQSAFECQDEYAEGNQCDAQPVLLAGAFAEKDEGKYGNEYQAKFVDGGDLGGIAHLQGFEIGEP